MPDRSNGKKGGKENWEEDRKRNEVDGRERIKTHRKKKHYTIIFSSKLEEISYTQKCYK